MLDIFFSFLGLVLLAPVFFVVVIAVWWKHGTPIVFAQQRPGIADRPFSMYKFRTMLALFDERGVPMPDALRLTKLGKFLRSSSLDELPELWNVFIGDMSLVGPRPLLIEYIPLYSAEQARRHEVQPGITGWAQVNGRNALSWEEKFALDVWYVDNRSFWLDIKILARTVTAVFKRKGISNEGHATMPPFQGQ